MDNDFHDNGYLDACSYILQEGETKSDRTQTGTISTFGLKMFFDLQEGFPLLTTKKLHWKSIINELLWFIDGNTNIKWLNDRGVTIWDEWADENGDLGPIYGAQWRSWWKPKIEWDEDNKVEVGATLIDQLQDAVDTLMMDPDSRRNIVSAWNVAQIPDMALPPCHLLFQWNVRQGKYLDCQLYQRSCDFFLGVPYNIASYSALIHIMARCTGFEPGIFHWVGGDCHFYANHLEQIEKQLARTPRESPTLRIEESAPKTLDGWDETHFVIEGYDPHPGIKAPVAV